jgi:hypothetical protein
VWFASPFCSGPIENHSRQSATRLEYGMMFVQPTTAFALVLAASLASSASAENPSVSPQDKQQTVAANVESTPAWKVAIEARRKDLISRNGPGTDASLRDQLLQMRTRDQMARGFIVPSAAMKESNQSLSSIDAQLTSELKEIVNQKGWPTMALVGIEASNSAMLVLTHTPDHAWQLQLLPVLEQLADDAKIDPSGLALVVDKELVSEGKLQRYGSQFKSVNGGMAMYGVEDPDRLDQRRAQALLSPLKDYKELLEQTFHLKATGAIVSAVRVTPVDSRPVDTKPEAKR